MKISHAAQMCKLSVGAIRHYINLGIISPPKKNTKYYFRDVEIEQLTFIKSLKDMGLSIKEIEKIVGLKAVSNWVEPEDLSDYKNLLLEHKARLVEEIQVLSNFVNNTEEALVTLKVLEKDVETKPTGLPLSALDLIMCPHCQKSLNIVTTHMTYKFVLEGILTCDDCGYQAQVEKGILHTPSPKASQYDKPDLSRSVYKDNPKEVVNYIRTTSNWLYQFLPKDNEHKVYLETHLNSFFLLYKRLSTLGPDNIYILVDKFPEILEMYKRNIEYLNRDLKIIYICDNTLDLPLKHECVDCFIDYGSSTEHQLFNHTQLIERIHPFIKSNAVVLSTYFSFEYLNETRNLISKNYPESDAHNFNLSYYKESFSKLGYEMIAEERLLVTRNSGNGISFIFHQNGDLLYMDCMYYLLGSKTE